MATSQSGPCFLWPCAYLWAYLPNLRGKKLCPRMLLYLKPQSKTILDGWFSSYISPLPQLAICELGSVWTWVQVNLHPSVNLGPSEIASICELGSMCKLGSTCFNPWFTSDAKKLGWFCWFFFYSSGCRTIVWVQRQKTSLGHLMQLFTLCRVMEVEDLIHQVFSIPLGVWLGTMQITGSWSLPHLIISICWWSISSAKMAVSLTVSPFQESIQTFWAAIIQIPETALSPQMQICNFEVQIIICLTHSPPYIHIMDHQIFLQ